MDIICSKCSGQIDRENEEQLTSIVKRNKCPLCNEKVAINVNRAEMLKKNGHFLALIILNFFLVALLLQQNIVFHVINMAIVVPLLIRMPKIKRQILLERGLVV